MIIVRFPLTIVFVVRDANRMQDNMFLSRLSWERGAGSCLWELVLLTTTFCLMKQHSSVGPDGIFSVDQLLL